MITIENYPKYTEQKMYRLLRLIRWILAIKKGEFLAMGPSGMWKNLLLNILDCWDFSTSNSYRFNDLETTSLSEKKKNQM